MHALVVSGPGVMGIEVLPDPTPGDSDLVIEVRGCGLCGTDMHLVDGELPYDSFPVVPGHEFYGEVVAVGASVSSDRIGTLIAVDPNIPCRRCRECRRGRSNLCENYAALGITRNGGFAEYALVPETQAYELPAGVASHAAQLVEPLSCVVHGFDLLPRHPGDRYLVYGAGTMGLLMGMLAADHSAEQISVVEPNPQRRALATELGMLAVADGDELPGERGFDTVIDCSGATAAIEDGLTRVRRGGTFQCFGVADSEAMIKIRPFEIYRDEITIVGSMAVLDSLGRAIDIAAAWGERTAPLLSHRFDLDHFAGAFTTFRAGTGTKIVIGSSTSAADPLRLTFDEAGTPA